MSTKAAFAAAPPCPFCAGAPLRLSAATARPRRMRVVQRSAARMQMMSGGGAGGSESGGAGGGEPPEGRVITKALEMSFRNVWIRLMTRGIGQEYEDAIQGFVLSAIAAYKAGYSITALKFELAANEAAEYMGRDISLNDQEKETRLIWITLVYLTLSRYRFISERTPPPPAADLKGTSLEKLVPGLSGLVESICDAAQRGYNLQTYKMELNLKVEADAKPSSGAEASIRSQWSRIVFTTYNVLPDTQRGKPR